MFHRLVAEWFRKQKKEKEKNSNSQICLFVGKFGMMMFKT